MENNILSLLTKNERRLLNIKQYQKNELVFNEGQACNSIGVIVQGEIEIVSYSFSGKEVIFNSLSKDQIFGNNLLLSSHPEYKGDVISRTKSTIVFINRDNLLLLFSTNRDFLVSYLKVQSDFGKQLNSQIKMLTIDSARERFEYYLFINQGEIEYKSITSLANKLNLKRETLSRLLSTLEKENVIQRSLHKIIRIN